MDSQGSAKFRAPTPLRPACGVDTLRNAMAVLRPIVIAWLALLAACSAGPAPEPRPAETQPGATPLDAASPSSASIRPTGAPINAPSPTLERTFTGQDLPTIAIVNDYPVTQHVFVDGRAVGQVATGSAATFEVSIGVHTITSADSADPDDNPSSLTEELERGYGYRYRVLTK